jgi:hypothetical protein
MLPVNVAGKDAQNVVDTGSFNSLLRMSEAVRLGLKLERLTRRNFEARGFTRAKDDPFGRVSRAGNQRVRGRSKPPERRLQPGLAAPLSAGTYSP